MLSLFSQPDANDKLRILSADAQYDLSCACGSTGPSDRRRRGLDDRWLYPVTLANGGRSLMFKTLVSNVCSNDCKYCPLRAGQDRVHRCSLSPEEIVRSFWPYWQSGRVIGIFLTSGVCGNPDAAMARLIDTAVLLRRRAFRGVLHLKVIPGASYAAIDRAVALATAVSLNIETAGATHFSRLTARKDYLASVIAPLKRLSALTARGAPRERVKVSTQFVVGASDETDREIVRYMGGLYDRLHLHRLYFSAYQRGLGDPTLPGETSPASNADLLNREHRLYQTDFLLRRYGFSSDEIGFTADGNLPLDTDPKEAWARAHPERFPVDLQHASRSELLRVPGLGLIAVRRILAARAKGCRLRSLEQAGIRGALARKATPWLQT